MSEFPWGVVILLSCGLIFTLYVIYCILKLAHEEMKDETSGTHSVSNKSDH